MIFTPSEDGKTLTISGQGDLTKLLTTDSSARVFTDKAVGFVFGDASGYTKVAEGESYLANKTYYQAEYNYNLLFTGVPTAYQNGFNTVTSTTSWKSDVDFSKLYAIGWVNKTVIGGLTKVTESSTPNASNSWNYGELTDQAYYIISSEDISDQQLDIETLSEKGYQTISLTDFQKNYIEVSATYTVWDNQSLFVKHQGSDDFVSLVANQTYDYQDGDSFYKGVASYAAIENNEAFFGDKGAHPEYIKPDTKEVSFNELLLRKITEGSYEKVAFENESSNSLQIDVTTVQNILFPNSGINAVIKELDLGQATLDNLSSTVFGRTSDAAVCPSLEALTLPLTNKTIVKSPTTQTNVSKMVVPSGIIPTGYTWNTSKLTTIHIPEGYERVGDKAFLGNPNMTDVTFPNTLELIGDSAFQNCGALREIVFNEGLENIGVDAFSGNSLTSVKFPSTLLMINDGAFRTSEKVNRFSIKLNAGLKYIGNSAFALGSSMDEKVLEIPASVRYIGPFAFNFRQYQDVYFYAEKAPFMPIGKARFNADWGKGTAFNEHTLDGNTGFDPTASKTGDDTSKGYANRENYINSGAYFCILHFPKDLDEAQRAAYTDITRIYRTDPSDEFHKDDVDGGWNGPIGADIVGQEEEALKFGQVNVVGKRVNWGYQDTYLGSQYIWPSQAQFNRAYATVSNGVCWDGVTKYRPTLDEGDLAVLAYAGYKLAEDGVTDEDKGVYSMDDLMKIAHLGTRQFVLTNADVTKDEDEKNDPTYPVDIKGGQWWTICVPFNMTKSQVDATFGTGTHVCVFNDAQRLVEKDNASKKYIYLYFQKDAYLHKTTIVNNQIQMDENATVGDDDVVIYAHQSYMIYPTKSSEDPNGMYNVSDYKLEVGSPLPKLVKANEAQRTDLGNLVQEEGNSNKEYRFIGNYLTQLNAQSAEQQNSEVSTLAAVTVTIPQYSYIFAAKGDNPAQFWFYTGTKAAWKANKCVVQATAIGGGEEDGKTYFGLGATGAAKQAIQQSFFGEDSTPTGIEEVVIIAGEGNDSQIVYNLNGQVVNMSGNLDGLQKGVYIKNGKKYMVK